MIQINLLPWREQARKINKVRFFVWMGIFISAALIALLIFHIWFARVFYKQQALNDYLTFEINQEQNILTSLTQQQEEKKALENQLLFIIQLHKKNYSTIRLLNELKTLVPSQILLNKIIKQNGKITLAGIAKSDADLTLFKQKLDQSLVFSQPVLKEVSSEKNTSNIDFVLEIIQEDVV